MSEKKKRGGTSGTASPTTTPMEPSVCQLARRAESISLTGTEREELESVEAAEWLAR